MIRMEKGTGTWLVCLVTVAAAAMVAAGPSLALGQLAGKQATRPGTINAEEAAKQRFTKRQFEQLTAKMIE